MTKYSGIAYSDPFIANAAMAPPANVGTRSSDRSNIGCATRLSTTPNAASSTTPAARQAITPLSDQVVSPALISPYTNVTSPRVNKTNPAQSGGVALSDRDSSTRQMVTISANTPTGMLTR